MHERNDLNGLIGKLQKQDKGIWKRAAELLSKPRRNRVEVNLSKIEQYAPEGSTVLVPGKVLGAGKISRKLTIAAFSFSDGAKKAISEGGAKTLTIDELFSQNPDGKSVVILI
jgi:large subunit ribosomal protein L18e